MSSNKRKSLTALQKKEICLAKQIAPFPTNQDLANAYDIGKSTVGDILREKEKWLTIDGDSSDANPVKILFSVFLPLLDSVFFPFVLIIYISAFFP
jgi:hypothetical protein